MIISKVKKNSIAYKNEVKKGDDITHMNSFVLEDIFDFLYAEQQDIIDIVLKRYDTTQTIKIKNPNNEPLGIEFIDDGIKTKNCHNNCIFCFVNQLPKSKDLRQTLRVKDDDFRLSMINGTYITLTNLTTQDIDKIKRLKMSPLYISVHTTNQDLRGKMLGLKRPAPVLPLLKNFFDEGIEIHTQIVYCPNINEDLEKSIVELSSVCTSLAIVPVGLTKYQNPALTPVNKHQAANVIKLVEKYQKKFYNEIGTRFVWAADEFYLRAKIEIPEYETYENFDQIENGVGLIAKFDYEFLYELDYYKKKIAKLKTKLPYKEFSLITGESAFEFISKKTKQLEQVFDIKIFVYKVKNNFLGETVTVAGLISGLDIVNTVKGKPLGEKLLIPATCLKEFSDQFLDNYTIGKLEKELNIKLEKVEIDGASLVEAVL